MNNFFKISHPHFCSFLQFSDDFNNNNIINDDLLLNNWINDGLLLNDN